MYNQPMIAKLAPSVLSTVAAPNVSDRYQLINTASVIERMEAHGWLVVQASQNAVRNPNEAEFTQHSVRLRRARDLLIGKGHPAGALFSEISVVNSHNRSSQFEVRGGLFRLACSNGLVVSAGYGSETKVRHSGKATEDNVDAAMAWAIGRADDARKAASEMGQKMLTDRQARNFAREALELFSDVPGSFDINSMLAVRRDEDAGNSLWNVFNRVQESISRGGIRRTTESGRNSRTTGLSSIHRYNEINEGLWSLAEKALA